MNAAAKSGAFSYTGSHQLVLQIPTTLELSEDGVANFTAAVSPQGTPTMFQVEIPAGLQSVSVSVNDASAMGVVRLSDTSQEMWNRYQDRPAYSVPVTMLGGNNAVFVAQFTSAASSTVSGSVTVKNAAVLKPFVPEMPTGCSPAYEDDLIIGFTHVTAGGDVVRMAEADNLLLGFGNGQVDGTYVSPNWPMFYEFPILAVRKELVDGMVVYKPDNKVSESIQVNRVWLEYASGDETLFSFAQDQLITERTNLSNNTVAIHAHSGSAGATKLYAEITVTINGETLTRTVSAPIRAHLLAYMAINRPLDDTAAKLNEDLAAIAEQIKDMEKSSESFNIVLASTTYEGDIVLPEEFQKYAVVNFRSASQTTLIGSLDLNGSCAEFVTNVHFIAPNAEETTKAITGGAVSKVENCSFRGYDIALDGSTGVITPRFSTFIDNGIGVLMDTGAGDNSRITALFDWEQNTFLNNGTAIQVKSLSSYLTPYYFRVFNSNFIGNETDLDIQQDGTFYMYKNYYGNVHNQSQDLTSEEYLQLLLSVQNEDHINQIVSSNSPNIAKTKGVKIVTNPRWKHPVWEALHALPNSVQTLAVSNGAPYENSLIADWTQETQIVNTEADDLIIDSGAFTGEEEKVITVVNGEEEVLEGTWTFQ